MSPCPCYDDCELLPDGRCLRQAIVEVVVREQERAHELFHQQEVEDQQK